MATKEQKERPATNFDADLLPGWRDGAAKRAILEFVQASEVVPAEERVAVFDNDGTLWCEKPMPIQLDFILRRLVEMAEASPDLRDRQPWKAAYERDYGWLGALMTEHYAGDDSNVKIMAAGILAAYEGISVEDFEAQSDEFLPRLPRSQRIRQLHRFGRRPRLHAPDQHGGIRRSARAGHRE